MFWRSLRFRILFLVVGYATLAVILTGYFNLQRLETVTTQQLEHEGVLLADTILSAVASPQDLADVPRLQAQIDRLVSARDDDIEINVIVLEGEGATIIASNVPDNIEPADDDEHEEMLKALARGKPVAFIEVESEWTAEDYEFARQHPDAPTFAAGERVLNINSPIIFEGQPAGSINIKVSLAAIDRQINRARDLIIIAMVVEFLFIGVGVGLVLESQLFRPLATLVRNMQRIASHHLDERLPSHRRDEVGRLAQAFNSMSDQLARARTQLHQYLNPLAIQEAYRRATAGETQPEATSKELTLLFADIVGFTSLTEKIGAAPTVALLNEYYDAVVQAVVTAYGHVDKFVADEIVCFFEGDAHADHALKATIAILNVLEQRFTAAPLRVRIGICSGMCLVVDVGSNRLGRLDRTMIGDAVNTAQRLMTHAQPNTAVVASATVAKLQQTNPDLRYRGALELKGKQEQVEAYMLAVSWKSTWV